MAAITVGITFHNPGARLRDAVESVLAQTEPDWELILLDDESTEPWTVPGDRRIRRHRTEGRLGLAASLNRIAALAQSAYLARMDSDDLMHPRRLEAQLAYLRAHAEIAIAGSAAYSIDQAGRVIGIRGVDPPDTSPASLLRRNPIIHPTVAGRTEWFRANPYDPTYRYSEDHELWCRTAASTRFGHLAEPLLFYREGAGGVRRYLRSTRYDRRAMRRHGPAQVGWAATAGLLLHAYARSLAYPVIAAAGYESRLIGQRGRPLTPAQRTEAEAALKQAHGILRCSGDPY